MKAEAETLWANAGLFPSEDAIRDHLLFGLLQEGSPIPEDYPERLNAAGIRFAGDWFGLVGLQVVAVDAWSCITGLGHTAWSEAHLTVNLLERFRALLAGRADGQVFKAQDELFCIVSGACEETAARSLQELAELLLSTEEEIAGVRFFANLSEIGRGVESLGRARQCVRCIGEYRMIQLDTAPVLEPACLTRLRDIHTERADIVKEQTVLASFRSGNYREASALFGSLWDQEYLMLAKPLMLVKHKCVQYLDSLMKVTEEMTGTDSNHWRERMQPEKSLLEAGSYPEVRARMEHFFGSLNDLVLESRRDGSGASIAEVKDYIRGNYTDPDLNVNRIAEELGRSAPYLSRSFRRVTGTSIPDYIHRYRIQEAKILIGRGVTIAEAAEAVGYSSVLTMSRAFKRYEGTTPGKLKN